MGAHIKDGGNNMSNVEDKLILTFNEKKKMLEEIGEGDLIDLFNDYKTSYKPIKRKKSQLDQQISAGITADEKEMLTKEFNLLKKAGTLSKSAFIRNRVISEIDIEDWKERALRGLKDLNEDKWDKAKLEKQLKENVLLLENLDQEDDEGEFFYEKKITELERMIAELSRPTQRRGYKISGRVTFNEASHIRWRAARLTLTVADYIRFMLFGYTPFSDADTHLSLDARRRFYISVLDVSRNGWGKPPHIEECPNCNRYMLEARAWKEKLERIQRLNPDLREA